MQGPRKVLFAEIVKFKQNGAKKRKLLLSSFLFCRSDNSVDLQIVKPFSQQIPIAYK